MTLLICNPIDLSYRVQQVVNGRRRRVFREAADPSVVRYRDRYYLFASMSGGFWHSGDLHTWEFVATPGLPVYDYAPDVREIDGRLVVCASRRGKPCDFYRSAGPKAGDWEVIPGEVAFWDPNLFQDDDGRVYLYEGCSANAPIRGVELDRATLRRIGKPVALIGGRPDQHGWERPAEDFDPERIKRPFVMRLMFGRRPFIEGAWMVKHAGRYQLQYAAPATQFNGYADGTYIGNSPLGPFEYEPHSPFSSKPGGFVTGAGHGSTFQDEHGNWWHAATMRISVHHDFERRLGLFPAGFDDDGVFFCNQEFADYPLALPDAPADPWSLTGRWMLLSAGCAVTASSTDPAHPAHLAVTEDIRTWWKAATTEPGEWLTVALPADSLTHAIQVNPIEDGPGDPPAPSDPGQKGLLGHRFIDTGDVAAPFLLEGSADGTTWTPLRDATSDGRSHDLVVLAEPQPLRFVRVTGGRHPLGTAFAVTGLRVFGLGTGPLPAAARASARRTDPLTAHISWPAAAGARGYNVRYGLAPDKLYHCWQVDGATALDLRSLNAGHAYWVAVDTFNTNGVTRGTPVPIEETSR
ncbi:family 43 glycosylhydrolase [Actinoplanes sp. NPDC026670]|uniref:family 43 glycosylhydrolase n=1 Tax=Actinoplanes sp. NPDC026670 TaxID=3154700 RepID=UPI0033C1F090